MNPFSKVLPFDDETGNLLVIVDTPKGSRNKFAWNEEREVFELSGVLPVGAVFPYDFGFIPNTRGGDGDPLDVLILMDEPAFTGCLVETRLLGVIEADQTEKGETTRNDRLIAVSANSRTHGHLQKLEDLSTPLVDEIEHFFVSYNAANGKQFKPLGRFGPDCAKQLVDEAQT